MTTASTSDWKRTLKRERDEVEEEYVAYATEYDAARERERAHDRVAEFCLGYMIERLRVRVCVCASERERVCVCFDAKSCRLASARVRLVRLCNRACHCSRLCARSSPSVGRLKKTRS